MTSLQSLYYTFLQLITDQEKYTEIGKKQLINELLCAAVNDVVFHLIKRNLAYDDYFSDELVARLNVTKSETDEYLSQTLDVIEEIAKFTYKLESIEVIRCIQHGDWSEDGFENQAPMILLEYYVDTETRSESPTLKIFLSKQGRHLKFTTKEIDHYAILFESYMTKLKDGHLGLSVEVSISFTMFLL